MSSFGQQLGDSLLNILKIPVTLATGLAQNIGAGYVQGNVGFGSRDSGDSGSWINRNATIVIISIVALAIILFAWVMPKKKR